VLSVSPVLQTLVLATHLPALVPAALSGIIATGGGGQRFALLRRMAINRIVRRTPARSALIAASCFATEFGLLAFWLERALPAADLGPVEERHGCQWRIVAACLARRSAVQPQKCGKSFMTNEQFVENYSSGSSLAFVTSSSSAEDIVDLRIMHGAQGATVNHRTISSLRQRPQYFAAFMQHFFKCTHVFGKAWLVAR
jgi:hypothetical protein